MLAFPGLAAFAMAQDTLEASRHDVHLLMWFVGIIAASLIAQAVGVVFAAIFAARFLQKMDSMSKSMEQKTTPILVRTNELLRDLSPKIHTITTNAEQVSYTVRAKVDELGNTVSQLNETVAEINDRSVLHIRRADAIVGDALDAAEEISATVQENIRTPIRQVSGIIAGVQAAVETLIRRSPLGRRR